MSGRGLKIGIVFALIIRHATPLSTSLTRYFGNSLPWSSRIHTQVEANERIPLSTFRQLSTCFLTALPMNNRSFTLSSSCTDKIIIKFLLKNLLQNWNFTNLWLLCQIIRVFLTLSQLLSWIPYWFNVCSIVNFLVVLVQEFPLVGSQ